jgi:hypothetical protein
MPLEITKPIADWKNELVNEVDSIAGNKRLNYITDIPAQDLTYISKLNEAKDFKNAGYPIDATPYLWINTEALATNKTTQEVVDNILAISNSWAITGAKIEGYRLEAKTKINAATDITSARQFVQQFKNNLNLV